MTGTDDTLSTQFFAKMSIATPDPSRLQLMVLLYGAGPLDCLQLLSVDLCGAAPLEVSTPLI